MYALVFFLFLISNSKCDNIISVRIGSDSETSLEVYKNEDTYFYVENTESSGDIYFLFLGSDGYYSFLDVCYTNTKSIPLQDCYGSRELKYENKNVNRETNIDKYYYKYKFTTKRNYLIIKYKSTVSLEVKVSYSDLYVHEQSVYEKVAIAIGELILIIIGVIVGISIIIVIGICICRRKRVVSYQQPNLMTLNNNSGNYGNPMITQTPVIQDNLLYSKPA